MPKRILIFFLVPFIMLSVVTCDNTPYEEPESTGTINISLVLPLDKGSIEVNYYQIVDVSITITAPDSTQEIRTWQPGDSTTLIFQNKGTGTYHISIWERDSDNNEFTYDEFFTVTHGYNVVITVYLGGNIIVEIVPGDTPEFTEFQRIPTIGALDWEAFTIGRHTFLAVANSSDDSTFNLASRIYQWNGIPYWNRNCYFLTAIYCCSYLWCHLFNSKEK